MNIDIDNKIQSAIQQLNSDNAEIREEAALELAKIGNESIAEKLLNKLSEEKNPDVKQMIIYALGEIGSEKAISILKECSKDDDFEIRWVAVEALGKFSSPNEIKFLRDCLKTEPNYNVRGAIIRTLANSVESKFLKTLILNLNQDENISEFQNFYRYLRKPDVQENFENIIKIAQDKKSPKVNNKPPKVLIDGSLILDISLEFSSFFMEATNKIMKLVLSKTLNGYITERDLREIWYTYKELEDEEYANHLIILLLVSFNFCKIDSEMIKRADKHYLSSFVTSIQLECVTKNQLDAIITLSDRDFLWSDWQNVYSPLKFLNYYNFRKKNFSEKISSYLKEQKQEEEEKLEKEKLNKLVNLQFPELEVRKTELFKGWIIEDFELLCCKNSFTSSTVIIFNPQSSDKDCRHCISTFGIGATATLFAALDKVITHILEQPPQHTLDSLEVYHLEPGLETPVQVDLVVEKDKVRVKTESVDKNIIKACFYAYVEAIKAIYSSDSVPTNSYCEEQKEKKLPMLNISETEFLQQHKNGAREFHKIFLREANLIGGNLEEIDLSFSDLSFSNLHEINLSKATLTETIFTKAIVTKANFHEARLWGSKLNNAILRNSQLVQTDLNKADLTEANLENANLFKANLTGAILTNANLSKANLTGAILTNANLSKANLTGAILTNANLSKANLTGVNFTDTTVDGANFSEANLSHADLTNLELNNTVFCKPVLTDTQMPEIKIEIYGQKRIEKLILLFSQFKSNHYKIFAVHSNPFDVRWNNDIEIEFRQINKELRKKGIPIQRVFIVNEDNFNNEMNEIIEEQVDIGIEVRCLSQKEVASLSEKFRSINLLVCENTSVKHNSFTTRRLINEKQEEESGYISFVTNDIENNKKLFNIIWEKAETTTRIR